MRDWSLGPNDPLCLTLAAEARLCIPDYTDDHIWELELGSGEPAALSLRTTYGLRARSMRLFPRFSEGNQTRIDPRGFVSSPRVERFYPNFLRLSFSPLEEIAVTAEYWVPESQVITGRMTCRNCSKVTRHLRLELCGTLVPLGGQALSPFQIQMVNVLVGRSESLTPVVFLTGGPQLGPGPYPSLALDLELAQGVERQFTWAQAACADLESSFDLARRTVARPWDAECARIEVLNASHTVDIYTGDIEWDAALAFSQKVAFSLFFPGNTHLPQASFVSTRQTDQGHSRQGDGRDHPPSWSGQSPLESYYLASLLPGASALRWGLLRNFLAVETEHGFIDGRPGLAGQRSKYLATPLLASLAWELLQFNPDEEFLEEIYAGLRSYFWSWFSAAHDPDRDGLPQWEHPSQTGFEDNPLFDLWNSWSQGADITCVRSPALFAMLFHEAQALIEMAERLHHQEDETLLREQAESLRAGAEACWQAQSALYRYRDRETHLSGHGKILVRQKGPGAQRLGLTFKHPVRLLFEVLTKDPAAPHPEVSISEYVSKASVETIPSRSFRWRTSGLVATSQRVYARIGKIKVRGLGTRDKLIVRTVDYTSEDHTLLLPLWAGIPEAQRAQALVSRWLLEGGGFHRPFGIPACPSIPRPEAEAICLRVHLPWNQLIGEGLLAYGYRDEAADLVARLMATVIQNLKNNRAFYQYYHAERGSGLGERNALGGLAPVGLFLRVLGVEIQAPRSLRLSGLNPYPWPVTVKYRGLTVTCLSDRIEVALPDGGTTVVTDSFPRTISL
jgi:hypothetical protein